MARLPSTITQGRLWDPELRRVRFFPTTRRCLRQRQTLIQSIMMESLLSTTADGSLPARVVIKSLSRGVAIFRQSAQGA